MGLLAQPLVCTALLEKRNPLPPGRYWIDIVANGRQQWDFWAAYATGHLVIEREEHYVGDAEAGYESRDWILFRTDEPLTWDLELRKKIGWPTIAGKEVQTSNDTVQKPKPEGILDEIFGTEDGGIHSWVKFTAIAGVGALGMFAIAKLVRG